jgi:putative copper resistance protein D
VALDFATAAARFLTFAGVLALWGSTAFFSFGIDATAPRGAIDTEGWHKALARVAAAMALGGSVLWLIAEAALLGADSPEGFGVNAILGVVTDTRFGQIGALRCAALLVLLLPVPKTYRKATWMRLATLAAIVMASLAWTGHGGLGSGWASWIHLGSDVLHLLTAGLWIGALIPLCVLAIRAAKYVTSQSLLELTLGLDRFSAVGLLLVAVLLVSGIINTWFLVGPAPWSDIGRSLYGRLVLVKVGLFVLMIAIAAINRWRLAPRLGQTGQSAESAAGPLRALRRTLITETAAALAVLAVVAILGMLEPPSEAG